jgi:phosphoribosyl 1,2-cyclic phosphate phosphodiesterase
MKLTFLGTGAADWDINAYVSGAFHRRFSSVLINNDLLIDPGPHVFHYAEHSDSPHMLDGVKHIIVTHTHDDHFCPETVERLCADRDCILWGDMACLRRLRAVLGEERTKRISFVDTHVRTGLPYPVGKYRVWSLRSNHATEDSEETTRMYLVGDGERILLYGCDSAWIPTTSWNTIKDFPVNTAILELTCGEAAPDDWRSFEHNTLDMLELMLRTFRKYDRFAPDVRFYVSHMARTLHTDPDRLRTRLAPLGVTPAYDGLCIDV